MNSSAEKKLFKKFMNVAKFNLAKGNGDLIFINDEILHNYGFSDSDCKILNLFLTKFSELHPALITSDKTEMGKFAPDGAKFKFVSPNSYLSETEIDTLLESYNL